MARSGSTSCLPSSTDASLDRVANPRRVRAWLDQTFRDPPARFPQAFAEGYRLKDNRSAAQTGRRGRRVRLTAPGESFSLRPSFVLPSRTGLTDGVPGPLFLRAFGVPLGARARVCGRDPMDGYRREVARGRNRLVGTTLRTAPLPEHLLADEHHPPRDGVQNDVAPPVGGAGGLGGALAPTAGAEDVPAADAVFPPEAADVQPDYQPPTVSGDGGAATPQAGRALFPLVGRRRCFRHGGRNLRSRGKRRAAFAALAAQVGDSYHAADRRSFAQRLRRWGAGARGQPLTAWLREHGEKLGGRVREYGEAYPPPGGHRTRNMRDRLLRSMHRSCAGARHRHGSQEAGARHGRAGALLPNFRPWHPALARAHGGWRRPAARRNRHRYHDDGRQSLRGSASRGGYRRGNHPPHNP